MLNPDIVIKKKIKSLSTLAILLPNIVGEDYVQLLDDEWRELRNLNFTEFFSAEEIANGMNVEYFWKTICNIKRCNCLAFPILQKVVYYLLCIPISTANVERTFSAININKTKTRNKLQIPTLEGILLSKGYMSLNDTICSTFQISKNMLSNFNASMYENTETQL